MAWSQLAHLSAPASGVFQLGPLDLSSYPVVVLFMSGIVVDTDGVNVLVRSMVAGVEFSDATHRFIVNSYSHSGTTDVQQANTGGSLPMQTTTTPSPEFGVGNAAGECLAGMMEIFVPGNAVHYKQARWRSAHILPSGNKAMSIGAGAFPTTSALDGFRVISSPGSLITAGKVTLLGMETS